jgi:CHAT domain-containing protein
VADLRAAREDLEQVIAEIRDVPGYEDFLAAPSFDDVAGVATEQPLVYVTPADLGGVALVVRGDEVTHVQLEELTVPAVAERVAAYADAYPAREDDHRDPEARRVWRDAVTDVTGWLWSAAMERILDELRPEPRAVLVAGGLLGLLPLHAAWTKDPGYRCALDELTLTYAPNARSLASARELAARPAERILAVPDPTGDLRCAAGEADAAIASFPTRTVLAGAAADPGAVAAALRDCDVAHFACHGFVAPRVPLNSGVTLTGEQPLTLRDIVALDLRMRLVVLSACETLIPGTELPDEVVALPTGLLQAGVGGIVASLWPVDDVATLIVMVEFYRLWRWEQVEPPEALRRAQQWLRDTPNGEIVRIYRAALDERAGWLPSEAADQVLADLQFEDAEKRKYARIDAWAAFAYVGA